MESMDKNPVTRTFRIESEYDKVLREEANNRGISVNNLANHILKEFIATGRFSERGQNITFATQSFENFLNCLDEQELIDSGQDSGSKNPHDRLLMRGMTIDRTSLLWYLKEILGGYNDWFICDMHERKDYTLIHLRHSYNRKWSLFLENYLKGMFSRLLEINDIEIEITKKTVSLRLPK